MSEETTAVVATPEEAPSESTPGLFRFDTWVHVGPGAEECSEVDEEKGENRCGDSGHFHAYCRLPNQFQEKEIRDRAEAARARRLRQFRVDGSDSHEVMEASLEDLRAEPDAVERMTNELLGYDWTGDYLTAVRQVRDLDDESENAEEGAKLYEHVDNDRVRFAKLHTLPEDERPEDELNELQEHLAAYELAVKDRYEGIAAPKRESYEMMAESDLVDLVRRKRMHFGGQQAFLDTYNAHQWLSCAYRETGGEPVFQDLDVLQHADRGVIAALDQTFSDLERTAQQALGN